MTSGRNSSRLRLSNITPCDDATISSGYSGSSLFHASDLDISTLVKNESKRNDGDDNNNNNSQSASTYVMKLLDSKYLSNDFDASPSTFNDSDPSSFSYVSMKSTSQLNTRSSTHKHTPTLQKKSNRQQSQRHKPAEVFRKDLISAMKIPDTSQLFHEEYWVMQDSWRIEWEKGVQVPVNQKAIPRNNVSVLSKETHGDFRMPRKMVKSSPEPGDRDMVDLNVLADSTCRYDLDELDVHWLKVINEERKLMGLPPLDEYSMEQIMEELETQCHENMQLAIQTKEGLGIEYDEDVVCDVCRMPDCEEGNEMVFCDGCNLCVHQACYGILKVPDGSWLCKPCALGVRGSAVCVLCDRKGGAMKSTRSGSKWAHVICALWIPEISIGDPERMEPITKVSHVPASRWALVCSLCKERAGACIQCSVKHCVTAYHVTCALEAKLDMNADCASNAIDDDAVIFRSYCKKHSKNRKDSDSEEVKSAEEKSSQRQHRIMELEEDFCTLVKASAVENRLSVPLETAQQVLVYWKLKRKANFDKPLITPKHEEDTALAEAAETNLQRRLRMFTHLRQDLERVRNLCYMIGRREKTKRATVKNMESVFLTQMKLLERRMCHEPNYNPHRMVAVLQKFGKPKVCELGHKESALLAKTSEWTKPAAGSKKSRTKSPVPMQVTEENKEVSSQNDKELEVSDAKELDDDVNSDKNITSCKLKNGLHRKAFMSACQKREALLKKDSLKSNVQRTQSVSEKRKTSSIRKRSYQKSSDSESENQVPFESTALRKTRRAKAQAWTAWRTAGAAASPSAFTVKTEKRFEHDVKSGSDTSGKCAKVHNTSRSTRSSAVLSDTAAETNEISVNVQKKNSGNNLQFKNTLSSEVKGSQSKSNSHLIVKWESDKSDNPDIMESSTVVTTRRASKSEQNKKRFKSESTQKEDPQHRQLHKNSISQGLSTRLSSRESSSEVDANGSLSARPPRRLAASRAKNVSGALAHSCESGSCNTEDLPVSLEQGLQKQSVTWQSKRVSRKENVHRARKRRLSGNSVSQCPTTKGNSSVMSSITNIPKDDEDGGYKGDMDESDSEVSISTPLPQTKSSLHAEAVRENQKSTRLSDSDISSHQKRLVKSVPAKRRRLKAVRLRRRCESSLISFKGFKDMESGSSTDTNQALRRSSMNASVSLSPKENLGRSKNEDAAGDICVKDAEFPRNISPFAGGQHVDGDQPLSTSSGLFSPLDSKNEISNLYSPYSNPIQPYSAFLPNSGLFSSSHMIGMPFMTSQGVYYPSPYSVPMWQPLPIDGDQNLSIIPPSGSACQPVSENINMKSPLHPLPDSTLSPESQQKSASSVAVQANYEHESASLSKVPVISSVSRPISPVSFPCNSQTVQSSVPVSTCSGMSNVKEDVNIYTHDEPFKKRKKKSKKKKKKKKRKKEKVSQSDYQSTVGSDRRSSHSEESSAYDEYCVEYCSTLVDNNTVSETPGDLPRFSENATPVIEEHSSNQACAVNLPAQSTTNVMSTEEPSLPQDVTKEESKLLLKIDKKRLVLRQESDKSSEFSSESDHRCSIESKKDTYITPLKLKLCGQKSDRTLRGGLVAREYQILEDDQVHDRKMKDTEDVPNCRPVVRRHAALRRLGLQHDSPLTSVKREMRSRENANTSIGGLPKVASSETVLLTPKSSLPDQQGKLLSDTRKPPSKATKAKNEEVRKKVRLKTPNTSSVSVSQSPSSSVAPAKGHTLASTINTKVVQSKASSVISTSSLQPERHWKKRKLHVHEKSVTDHNANKLNSTTTSATALMKPNNTEVRVSDNSIVTSNLIAQSSSYDASRMDRTSYTQNKPAEKQEKPVTNQLLGKSSPAKSGKKSNELAKSVRGQIQDGLPPVSPYKFKVAGNRQKKISAKASTNTDSSKPETTARFTFQGLKVDASAAKVTDTKPSTDDPYEFADFVS